MRTTTGAAAVAVTAYAGAVGLATGGLALRAELNQRLPFASPVFGGIALAALIGVPFTVLAALAWHGHRDTAPAALVCGLVLLGWVAIECAFLREFSFLQAIYVAVGVGFVLAGHSARRARLWGPPN